MKQTIGTLSLFIILLIGGVFLLQSRAAQLSGGIEQGSNQKSNQDLNSDPSCIPTFRDDDGPYYQPNSPFREIFVPDDSSLERFVVSGKVVSSDCSTPLSNVVLDVWHADDGGNYSDQWYRGRVRTNSTGEYKFTTVLPKGYSEGTSYRSPHIHFKIWDEDVLLVTSKMYLPEALNNNIDLAYTLQLSGKNEDGIITHYGSHTIIVPE